MIFFRVRKNSRSSGRLLFVVYVGFTQKSSEFEVAGWEGCKAFAPYTLNYSHIIIFPDLNSDKKNKHRNVVSDAYSDGGY